MAAHADLDDTADLLYDGVSLLSRRLHQTPGPGELSLPERSVLGRLERGGASATADLARAEQITPQAMALTLAGLQERGLVERMPDPDDRRRFLVSLTAAGGEVLHAKRHARGRQLSAALGEHFEAEEVDRLMAAAPLIKRLAEVL